MKKSFDYIVEQALNANGLTIRETAQFHYFNDNGLYEKKKESDEAINNAVDSGKCSNGAILAYGSFNDFYEKRLIAIATGKKNQFSRIDLKIVLEGLQNDINKAYNFLKGV